MRHTCPRSRTQRLAALVAALFGLATLVAGGRILLGLGEAGYEVVQPVLLFNTVMGVPYLIAAVLILRDARWGRRLAGGIAALNVIVLLAVFVRRFTGGPVADETLVAMALRASVWVAIAIALTMTIRRTSAGRGQGASRAVHQGRSRGAGCTGAPAASIERSATPDASTASPAGGSHADHTARNPRVDAHRAPRDPRGARARHEAPGAGRRCRP